MPFLRLGSFYFFFFASIGVFVPYWNLYLIHDGYTEAEIGELAAILVGTKIIAPYLWGWVGDKLKSRLMIIRLGCLASLLCFSGVYWADSYWSLAAVILGFSFFWNAALPQYEAVTLQHLGAEVKDYSRVRLWGSVGFIVSVLALGTVLDKYGVGQLPAIILGLFAALFVSSLLTPAEKPTAVAVDSTSILTILKQPAVIAILLICLLIQMSHAVYYTFFSVWLEAHHYSATESGIFWAIGVVAEVILFLYTPQLLQRFSPRALMLTVLLITAIRWVIVACAVEYAVLLGFAQILHMITFGLYHAVAIFLIHQYFPGALQGRGQALYTSLSFGVGGALGAYWAGHAWVALGAETTWFLASLCSMVGVLFIKWIK